MSHYFTNVIVPATEQLSDVEQTVTRLLAPYDENIGGKHWDGWIIGGQWDGVITGRGPATTEVVCDLCHGTGRRPGGEKFGQRWLEEMNGCNGCRGAGHYTEYTGQYGGELARNVCAVADRVMQRSPLAIVTPDGKWHQIHELYDDTTEEECVRRAAAIFALYADGYQVVGVDCHV